MDCIDERRTSKVFGRIKYEPLGTKQTIYCETEELFMRMIQSLIANRVWFDVDFPDMKIPEKNIK
jgi:hypothetical protein